MKLLPALLFFAATLGAQTPDKPTHKKLWAISIAAFVAATSLDAASSWHQPESNGILASNGSFGGRALGIKFGIAGASILPQLFMPRHRRAFAIANFAQAGAFGAVAARNWRVNSGGPDR